MLPLGEQLNHLCCRLGKWGKECFVSWVSWGRMRPALQDDVSGFQQTSDCGSLQLVLGAGNKSSLFHKTNNLAVLSTGKETWLKSTPFSMFYSSSCNKKSVFTCVTQTVEPSGASQGIWMQLKCTNYIFVSCKVSGSPSTFIVLSVQKSLWPYNTGSQLESSFPPF